MTEDILARYRRILVGLEPQEDEPGATQELVRELREWEALRRAATATILDLTPDNPAA